MSIDITSYTLDDIVAQERAVGVPFGPWHRQWLVDHAPDRVRKNLELAKRFPGVMGMARQGFSSMDTNDGATVAFGAVVSISSETNMVGTTQGLINQFCAIAANDARPGKMYEVKAGGVYGNTGTPTMVYTPRWGSSTTPATNVTLGASAAWTSITGTTALPWYLQFTLTIRTVGVGATQGTAYGTGFVIHQIPVTSSQLAAPVMMGATIATIDVTGQGTAGCGITMNLTWSANSASNTSTCNWWSLQSLN